MPAKNDSQLLDLLAKHQQGDEGNAFDQIRARYVGRVLGFARRLTGSHEEAEDLTQETFLLAARKSTQFRGQSAFLTWLLAIARNRHRDIVRTTHPTESLEPLDNNSAFSTPSHERESTQRILIQDTLAALPEAHRRAFECVVLQGMSSKEAGIALQMPPGTVRWRVTEATKLLRVALQDEEINSFSERKEEITKENSEERI
jgi:RNA polymerase sigma-70 factor, ECF subfamily